MAATDSLIPALLVVDMQEDFCAPHGSLGITNGRELAPLINKLLALPFALKVATRDGHPPDSLTFASQHADAKPFASTAFLKDPRDPSRPAVSTTLWPDHCVQGTHGANIIPEIDMTKLDFIVTKGLDRHSEMYSGFRDCFGRTLSMGVKHPQRSTQPGLQGASVDGGTDGSDASAPGRDPGPVSHDLAAELRAVGTRQVFCVGLAGDVCVKSTALDSVAEGFETFWVHDGQASVSPANEEAAMRELRAAGVKVVRSDGPELARVEALSKGTS